MSFKNDGKNRLTILQDENFTQRFCFANKKFMTIFKKLLF